MMADLQISEFRKCINNDTKDNVEADGRDEDKERHVIDHKEAKFCECIFCMMTDDILSNTT